MAKKSHRRLGPPKKLFSKLFAVVVEFFFLKFFVMFFSCNNFCFVMWVLFFCKLAFLVTKIGHFLTRMTINSAFQRIMSKWNGMEHSLIYYIFSVKVRFKPFFSFWGGNISLGGVKTSVFFVKISGFFFNIILDESSSIF